MDPFFEELPASVTVCDEQGVIVDMNALAARTFARDGGRELVGKSLLDCHPEPARSKLLALLAGRRPSTYTIEKGGKRKLVHQAPWFERGTFRGLVEISFEIPDQLPHFVRKP